MNKLYLSALQAWFKKGACAIQVVIICVGCIFSGNSLQAQLSIVTAGVPVTENFNSMGTSPTATIPTGFKWGASIPPDWTTGLTATTRAAGTTGAGILTGTSSGGCYNFANGVTASSTDRALGFLNSGSFVSPQSILLKITNNTGNPIGQLAISFNYEQYRSGRRQFDWTFFHGNTSTPSTSNAAGDQSYAAEATNTVISNPPTAIAKSFSLNGLYIPAGADYYLKWTLTGFQGSTNGKGLGIDDFSVTATATTPCTPPSTQASITFANIFSTQVDLNYTRGNGTGLMIVATNNAALAPLPLSGTSYIANSAYGSGTLIGGGNGYVVYNNTTASATVTVTNLTPGATYRFYVFEYSASGPCYLSDNTFFTVSLPGTASTTATDFFLSKATGDWNNALTWFSSGTSAAGPWVAADLKPTSSARGIQIQAPHIVTIVSAETARLLIIDAGAKLTYTSSGAGSSFTIADDVSGIDFRVYGTYELFGTSPTFSGAATGEVYNGALVRVVNNLTPNNSDNFARSTSAATFKTGSVFQWEPNLAFSTSDAYYFKDNAEIPTFRINGSPSVGATLQTTVYGLLDINSPLSWSNAGTKTFRNGIISTIGPASGIITQEDDCGQFIIGGTSVLTNTAQLGNCTINLNTTTVNGLLINNNYISTLIGNTTVNSAGTGVFLLTGSASLYCDQWIVSGSGIFTLSTNSTMRLGAPGGISASGATGNIQCSGVRTFNTNTSYIFNGIANQVTGSGMPATITALTIANTGAVGNKTVTLSNNNTSSLSLTLSSGLFAAGSTQQLNIISGGTVTAVTGDFAAGATAGIINFPSGGSFSGNCSPYDVYVGSGPIVGLNFGAGTVTIQNGGSFRINTGGYANLNGPFYAVGSTLVYNTGLPGFVVGREWVNNVSFPARGAPYHVTVQASGTTVLFDGANPARIMGGNLIISSGTALTLGTASGGDLTIGGNWQRDGSATPGVFNHNNRAVTFNGTTSDQTITVTNSGTETFAYLIINKTVVGFPNVRLNATNININGGNAGGNTLVFTSGNLDLNQNTLNFMSYNGGQNNIQVAGLTGETRYITSTGGIGNFAVYNGNTALPTSPLVAIARAAAGLVFRVVLAFSSNVRITIGADPGNVAGVSFGTAATTPTTNIDGTLQINTRGYVATFAPGYGTGSSLIYNTLGPYNRGTEWSATTGAGYPHHVTVQGSGTVLTVNHGTLDANRQMAGTLTISNGSGLILNSTAVAFSITILGNFILDGSITLPGTLPAFGADIRLAGNWTRSSTGLFVPNERAVFFIGSGNSIITANGGELFPYLYLTKAGVAQTISLNDDISIGKILGIGTGTLNLQNKDVILKSKDTTVSVDKIIPGQGAINYGGTGRFIVERYIPTATGAAPNHLKTWQFLAVPVNQDNQTVNAAWQEGQLPLVLGTANRGTIISNNVAGSGGFDIVGGVAPSMKYYNSGTWTGILGTGDIHYNQKGYMLFVRGDRSVITYNGTSVVTTLRTRGKIMEPGNTPPVISIPASSVESVGNPYASAIDFSNVTGIVRVGAVNDVFYLWDPRLGGAYGYGGYQTCTKSGANYLISPGGGSYGALNSTQNLIQSGQAFFVSAGAGGGTLTFNENAKTSGSSLVNRPGNNTTTFVKRLNNCLFIKSGADRTLMDGVVDEFDRDYSNQVDRLDAIKLSNTNENLGIAVEGKILAVERRGNIRNRDTIFYTLGQLRVQQYQFEFTPEHINRPGLKAYLVDKFLDKSTAVSLTDTTRISFNVTNNPGSYNSRRFMVVFRQAGLHPITSILQALFVEKDILVKWEAADEDVTGSYTVERSADGLNFVKIHSVVANGSGSYSWMDTDPIAGNNYYRIQNPAVEEQRSSYSNLVKVVSVEINAAAITVFPNPVRNGLMGLRLPGLPTGEYLLKLYNSNGQVVMKQVLNHSESAENELVKVPRNLPAGIFKLEISGAGTGSQFVQVLID